MRKVTRLDTKRGGYIVMLFYLFWFVRSTIYSIMAFRRCLYTNRAFLVWVLVFCHSQLRNRAFRWTVGEDTVGGVMNGGVIFKIRGRFIQVCARSAIGTTLIYHWRF